MSGQSAHQKLHPSSPINAAPDCSSAIHLRGAARFAIGIQEEVHSSYELGVLVVGVLIIKALLWVHIGAPIF